VTRRVLIYRDLKTRAPARQVLGELAARLRGEPTSAAVIAAGAVESALADADAPAADLAATLTDALADACLEDASASLRARDLLGRLVLPDPVWLTRPEGYAFYALDPRAYRSLARDYARSAQRPCIVLGVRSIGTSLSAFVRAELARAGVPTLRRTVRPQGHPWARTLDWSNSDERFFADTPEDASFVIVDEGPGLSGSTLLAVAEALLARGVSTDRIQIFCSHAPDPSRLLAENAAGRWARFRVSAAPSLRAPPGWLDLSGGRWREHVFDDGTRSPPSWTAQERLKFLDPERTRLLKFTGFAPYGDAPIERAERLAAAGFSPPVSRAEDGFLAYRWLSGEPLEAARDRRLVLDLLPRYLAFRARAFQAAPVDGSALEEMTRVNTREALGVELPETFTLEMRNAVYTDARLMPHEWIRTNTGVVKTDAIDHGDDHLLPGPTDVAWDLAGAVIEWALDANETRGLLERFRELSGDDASPRLPSYRVAYASFRAGVCSFAERAGESARWAEAGRYYRGAIERELAELVSTRSGFVARRGL
jgi:hypothetical protein